MSLIHTLVLIYLTSRLVGFLLCADVVLASRRMVCDPALEVKDVSLNCTKRVVVAHIEPGCGSRLSCLRSLLDNLNPLRCNEMALSPNFRLVYPFLRFNLLSKHRLGLVEVVLRSLLFFMDGSTRVVQLRDFFYWLGFVKQVVLK